MAGRISRWCSRGSTSGTGGARSASASWTGCCRACGGCRAIRAPRARPWLAPRPKSRRSRAGPGDNSMVGAPTRSPAMSFDPLARESIVALAGDLVCIPSVSPTIAPEEAHGEQAVASFAVEWLTARGVKAWLEEAAPGRPNAVAEVTGGEGPTLVLCAHLDTESGRAPSRERGRGSGDAACGIA